MPRLVDVETVTAPKPGTANFRNPHKHPTVDRGFVLRRLSNAKRRPKLFTKAEWRLLDARRRKAATDPASVSAAPDQLKPFRYSGVNVGLD
jgi:hypothetical protein